MRSDLSNVLTIRTPEGISFSMVLAGPVIRFLAWGIDACAVAVLMAALGAISSLVGVVVADFSGALAIVSLFVVSLGYGIALEWFWRGQTLGKRLLKLRVVDDQGLNLRFDQVVMRNLLRIVDRLPLFYLIGGAACWLTRYNQRLGDLAAGTVVMRVPAMEEPIATAVLGGKFNSFRDYPHLEARLRQCVSPREAALALESIVRRDKFEPESRIGLFNELADHFREQVTFPDEATLGMTDEQYTRNVVDSIYNVGRAERKGKSA